MSAQDGAQLVQRLKPAQVIPIHYEGWSHFNKGGKTHIEETFEKAGLAEKLTWLDLGNLTEVTV
jgi:hypothetical protein